MTSSESALQPLLVDTKQAAQLLACSPNHVRNLVERGELSSVRVGKLLRFSVEELRAFIAHQSQPQGSAAP